MSASHDAPTSSAHAAHADPRHAFDGEPVKVLPPDEPRTPGWVPLVGLLLFVVGGVYVLLPGDDAAPGSATSENTRAAARPAQAADAPPARPQIAPPQGTAPGGAPSPVQRLPPEAAKAMQQRLEEARARQAAQQAAGQPGQPQPAQPQRNILRPPAPAPAPGGAAQ